MDDTAALGSWITVVGGAGMFGVTVFGLAAGISAGAYGSIPAAVVVSGVGFVGLLGSALAVSGRCSWIEPLLARTGGIGCSAASIVLVNPLNGTPLPFAQLGLVGATLMVFGGSMLLILSVDREAVGTA